MRQFVVRVFFRYLVGNVVGEPDGRKINQQDLGIVCQFLNVEGRRPFKLNVTIMFAYWLDRVSRSKLSSIEVGGLVTYIAKEYQRVRGMSR